MRRLALGADVDAQAGAGGPTVVLISGAALKIGDVVHITATAKRVTKSTTVGDAATFAGVVVGGGSDFGADEAFFDTDNVGKTIVGAAGKSVVVQVAGIANVVAGDVITAGAQLMYDNAVAGRVEPGVVAGQVVGIALTAASAGQTLQMLIRPR